LPNVVTVITFKIGDNKYQIDGQEKTLGFPAFIKNGRTMTPLGFINDAFGAQVEYDRSVNGIVIQSSKKVLVMVIDKKEVVIDGKSQIIDVPAVLKENQVFVPLRFLVETFFESAIDWEGATQKIMILYDRSK
jgi:hypothetical protein